MKRSWQALSHLGCMTAMLSLPIAASAMAFTNGSFEVGGPLNGGFASITSSTEITGWTASNFANTALFWDGLNGFNTTAQDGKAVIGFGGSGTTGATLSQTFDTVAGTTYTINYFVEAQQLGSGAQSYRLEALNGPTVLNTVDAAIPATQTWVAHSLLIPCSLPPRVHRAPFASRTSAMVKPH